MTNHLNMWQLIDIIEKNKIQKRGKNWALICPFHEEKTPSCMINIQIGEYYCFGCSRQGNIEEIAFLIRGGKRDEINKSIRDFNPWEEIVKGMSDDPLCSSFINALKDESNKIKIKQ